MKAPLGDMDPTLFYKLVDEIATHKNTSIAPFFRGEALLHPRFLELLGYARRKITARIMLFTNGLLLDRSMADAILGIGIDHLSFSLDSPDIATYEQIRVGGNYRKVIDNIDYFLKSKKERACQLPETQVSMVRTEVNGHAVNEFVNTWKGKVDRIRIYEEHSRNGSFGSTGATGDTKQRKRCLKPFNEMVVYWDGRICLCNHDWDRAATLGTAQNQTLEAIWNDQAYLKVRMMHLNGEWKKIETCCTCDQWMAFYSNGGLVGQLLTERQNCGIVGNP
jgi:radical SAM protein with 4Fe4S-binding SPASM domain